MPILQQEPQLYPDDLFMSSARERRWWVLYTRSRQEKRLARCLREQRVPHYLPQREQRVRRDGKWRNSYLPLFPGYVFVHGRPADRLAVLRTNLLVSFLDVVDQGGLERQLADLWHLLESGVPLVPHPYIAPGDLVEIADGAFRGYRGEVLRTKGKLRLVVSISLLRQSVAAEVDREMVTPLHRRVARAS